MNIPASMVPALHGLQTHVSEFYGQFPPLKTDWLELDRNYLVQRALEAVEDTLMEAEENEEVWIPRSRDWTSVQFHPGYGLLPDTVTARWSCVRRRGKHGDKFHKMMFVLNTMKKLIHNNMRTTKRDIFYENFTEFLSQSEVDSLVSEIVTLVQVPRLWLGVMATSKGLVVGDLCYTNSEDVIVDCNLAVGGDSIPQDVTEITDIHSQAQLVLVVEKDAVFQKLLEEGILTSRQLPSIIMITGKGVPDLSSRQLVYRLSTELQLPVLILTDCDPYGVEIGLIYKYGSLAMTWMPERLAVPCSVWLGLLPSDIAKLEIGETSMKPLSRDDFKKLQDIHSRSYVTHFCPQLLEELECLWSSNRKAEIQQVSEDRQEGFLTHEYLPSKINQLGKRALMQQRENLF